MFEALKANMDNPPKEFTDLAIRMAEGSVEFYRDTVPAWAREAAGTDANLLKEFTNADAAVIRSLEGAAVWLKSDLLPRSRGKYSLGAENFAKQLRFEELLDVPLDRLLAIAEAHLKHDQDAFHAVAREIDANKTPEQVMAALSDDHPTEKDLIPAGRRTIEKIRQFLVDHKIVTIPSAVRPIVMETPLYARDGSFASMDTPGL